MKIICVGRNYPDHIKELGSQRPESPLLFIKSDTALVQKNHPFFIPDFSQLIHHEVEVLVKINRIGKHIQTKFASKYYQELGLGIDFTARDIQEKAKAKGHPWEKAKAFDFSAVISDFIPLETSALETGIEFHLEKNGEEVQVGTSKDMLFDIDTLICHLSQYFTLQTGDLIYTGTPAGVGSIKIGDKLEGFIQKKSMFTCQIK